MRRISNILFYVDGEVDHAVVERVVHIARVLGARLTFASAVEPCRLQPHFSGGCLDLDEIEDLLVQDRRQHLDRIVTSVAVSDFETRTRVLLGDPVDAIISAVVSEGYDFLVKQPAPSLGLRQHFFGGVDMHLLRGCPCPVSISRPKLGSYSKRVVTAVDYPGDNETKAQLNRELLDFALFCLETEFTEAYVVHAWSLYGESLLSRGCSNLPPKRLKEAAAREEAKRQEWLDNMVGQYHNTLTSDQAERFSPKIELLRGDLTVTIP